MSRRLDGGSQEAEVPALPAPERETEPKPYGAPGEPPLPQPWRRPVWSTGDLREKGWVPLPHLALWFSLLGLSVVVFYVLLTPVWLGLRGAAWVAELRSRARRS